MSTALAALLGLALTLLAYAVFTAIAQTGVNFMEDNMQDDEITKRRDAGESICGQCGYDLGTCPLCQAPDESGERYCRDCNWCEACGRSGNWKGRGHAGVKSSLGEQS